MDDCFHSLAFGLLTVSAICITVAAYHGFGQNIQDIRERHPNELRIAVIFAAISQNVAVFGMVSARWSIALLLLRIMEALWRKLRLIMWCIMSSLSFAALVSCVIFWSRCPYLRDLDVPGKCTAEVTITSMFFSCED
ncbi:integral membrane protein pth11 [Fusarium heterosporum]|uniref:Integral membrane protein pth11 n=1 Tax=Fusarium heterosporum TaxID=42747 RepID=A0A8H5TTK7_FUSHE|nr:integral membrane protein pth11 [Fusarium heterosporum]